MATQDRWFIKRVFNSLDDKIEQRLQLVGELVSSDARKNAPKLTGTLRDSITFVVNERENSVIIGTPVEYAPYIELGTRYITPRFFLTRALNENLNKIRNIFAKEMTNVG